VKRGSIQILRTSTWKPLGREKESKQPRNRRCVAGPGTRARGMPLHMRKGERVVPPHTPTKVNKVGNREDVQREELKSWDNW